MKTTLNLFKGGRLALVLVALVALVAFAVMPVLAQGEPAYVTVAGEGFAGRCNLRLYQHDGTKVAKNESIRYMVVYAVSQVDGEPSLLMAGNWSDPPVIPFGAVVMGWKSIYGPYTDKAAYEAKNATKCTVLPDYFWITWGAQGNYTARGLRGRLSSPYLTLDGLGVGMDWDEPELLSFGAISLRGKMKLAGNYTDPELRMYTATVLVQAVQVAGNESDIAVPHWSLQGKVKLRYLEDGDLCWDCLLEENETICEWLYIHFGINICYEPE